MSDRAVSEACLIVVHMLSVRDDVRVELMAQQQRVAVLGVNEVTTDVPEYRNLYQTFPGQDWDRLRGVGATLMIPVSSAGEENVLCTGNDLFAGENILVQTFATAVLLGVNAVDKTFNTRLQAAYNGAMSSGKWQNTYAATNRIEYYAEGVQDWFDANPERLAARRDPQRRQHARRAARLRSDAGGADRRDDARRRLAPALPVASRYSTFRQWRLTNRFNVEPLWASTQRAPASRDAGPGCAKQSAITA